MVLKQQLQFTDDLKQNETLYESFAVVPKYSNIQTNKLAVNATIKSYEFAQQTKERLTKSYVLDSVIIIDGNNKTEHITSPFIFEETKINDKPYQILNIGADKLVAQACYKLVKIDCPNKKCSNKDCGKCRTPQRDYQNCCGDYCKCDCLTMSCEDCDLNNFCANDGKIFCCDYSNKKFICNITQKLHNSIKKPRTNKCKPRKCAGKDCGKCPKSSNGLPCQCSSKCNCECRYITINCDVCQLEEICCNDINVFCCKRKYHKCMQNKPDGKPISHFYNCDATPKFRCAKCNTCKKQHPNYICKCNESCKCDFKQEKEIVIQSKESIVEKQIETCSFCQICDGCESIGTKCNCTNRCDGCDESDEDLWNNKKQISSDKREEKKPSESVGSLNLDAHEEDITELKEQIAQPALVRNDCGCARPVQCLIKDCESLCIDCCGHQDEIIRLVKEKAKSINYEVKDVARDGNCLPNSILNQYTGIIHEDLVLVWTQDQLRQNCLIGEKRNDGVFCDMDDILLIRNYLNISIHIVTPYEVQDLSEMDTLCNIFIGFYGNHYVALTKIVEAKPEPILEKILEVIPEVIPEPILESIPEISQEEVIAQQIVFESTYSDIQKLTQQLSDKVKERVSSIAGSMHSVPTDIQNIKNNTERERLQSAHKVFKQQQLTLKDQQFLIAFSDRSCFIFEAAIKLNNKVFSNTKFTDTVKDQIIEYITQLSNKQCSILIQAYSDKLMISPKNCASRNINMVAPRVRRHNNGGQSSQRMQRNTEKIIQQNTEFFNKEIKDYINQYKDILPKNMVFIVQCPHKQQLLDIQTTIQSFNFRCVNQSEAKIHKEEFALMMSNILQEEFNEESKIAYNDMGKDNMSADTYHKSKGNLINWIKSKHIRKVFNIVAFEGNDQIKLLNAKWQDMVILINPMFIKHEIKMLGKFTSTKATHARSIRSTLFAGLEIKEDQILFIYEETKNVICEEDDEEEKEVKAKPIQSQIPMIKKSVQIAKQTINKSEESKIYRPVEKKQPIVTEQKTSKDVQKINSPKPQETKPQVQKPQFTRPPRAQYAQAEQRYTQRPPVQQYFVTRKDVENMEMVLQIYRSLGMFKFFQHQIQNIVQKDSYTTKDLLEIKLISIKTDLDTWSNSLRNKIFPQNIRGALCNLYKTQKKTVLKDLYEFNNTVFTEFNTLKTQCLASAELTHDITQRVNQVCKLNICEEIKMIEQIIGSCSNQRCTCTFNPNLDKVIGKQLNTQVGGECIVSRYGLQNNWLQNYYGKTQFKMPIPTTPKTKQGFAGHLAVQPLMIRKNGIQEQDRSNRNGVRIALSTWIRKLEQTNELQKVAQQLQVKRQQKDSQTKNKYAPASRQVQTELTVQQNTYLQNLLSFINMSDGDLKQELIVFYEQKIAFFAQTSNTSCNVNGGSQTF